MLREVLASEILCLHLLENQKFIVLYWFCPEKVCFQFRILFCLFSMLLLFRVKITPNFKEMSGTNRETFDVCYKGVSFSVEAKQSLYCFDVYFFRFYIYYFVCLCSTCSIFPQSCFMAVLLYG